MRTPNLLTILTAWWLGLIAALPLHAAISQETPLPAEAPTIRVVADHWCPYSCTPFSSREGYMIDLLRALLAEEGFRMTYDMVPWNRALEMVESGEADIIAGINRTEATQGISLLHHSWGQHRLGFYSLSNQKWRFQGIESLKSIRLGAIPSYSYGPPIDDYLEKNRNNPQKISWSQGEYGMAVLSERLRQRDIDALVENQLVVEHWMRVNQQKDMQAVGLLEPTRDHRDLYIGISSSSLYHQKLIRVLDRRLPLYRQDGRLQQLLSLYYLKDWQSR
jgi:polar amino acid transport system substrate-binding protein